MKPWAAVWAVSYRRFRSAVGGIGVIAAFVGASVVVAALWLSIWDPLRGFFEPLGGDRQKVTTLLAGLLTSFLMVAVLVRVGVLAFDVVGRELRIMLASAPLGRFRRAAVAVGPELAVGVLVSVGLGGMGLAVFASVVADVGIVEVVSWMLATVVWVGVLSGVAEEVGVRLTGSMFTARAVASVVLLGVAMAAVFRTAGTLAEGAPVPVVYTWLIEAAAPWSVIGAMTAIVGGLVAWLGVTTTTTRSIIEVALRPRRRHFLRRPSPSLALTFAAVRTLHREPANRAAAFGFFVVVVALVEFEGMIGLGLSAALAVWGAVAGAGVVALSAYGGFTELGWTVIVSPYQPARALRRWTLAWVCVGAVVVTLIAAAVVWGFGESTSAPMVAAGTVAVGAFVVLGAALVAGRLVPYQDKNLMAMATTGGVATLMSVAVGAASAWLSSRLGWEVAAVVSVLWISWAWTFASRPPAPA